MSAKRIISKGLSETHYQADACVVWCFDDRVSEDLRDFLKNQGIERSDVIEVAGGAKALAFDSSLAASPEEITSGLQARAFLLDQIKTSVRLHKPKLVILMLHTDCGGYGYSKSFPGREAELAHHESELQAAEKFLEAELPAGITIETAIVAGER